MTKEEGYFFALNGSNVWAGETLFPTSRALAHNGIDCQYLLENGFFSHLPINFFNDLWVILKENAFPVRGINMLNLKYLH